MIIRGIDLLGQPFEERTATQNLSFQGCRYASKHHLPKNTWVTLEVPSGDSRKDAACVRARVAWIQRPRSLRELFQIGVEMEKPNNVWNVAFPPYDWNSEAFGEISLAVVSPGSGDARLGNKLSLEDYLRMASAHHEISAAKEREQNRENLDPAGLEQLKQDLLRGEISNGQPVAGSSELHDESSQLKEAAEKTFYDRWFEALERDKNSTKAEIASAVSEQVAAQLAVFEQNVKHTLTSEWNEKLVQSQTEPSKLQSDTEALRNEFRANAEAITAHAEERLNEKIEALRQELEVSLRERTAAAATGNERSATRGDSDGEGRDKFSKETETARREWNELLETSLDSAAERLAERISDGSRQVLRKAERELAGRVAELQKESGITLEMSQGALDDLRTGLEEAVLKASKSLEQIEHAVANYFENSRQAETQTRQSMDALRQGIGAVTDAQCAEIEKRIALIEKEAFERLGGILEQQAREALKRAAEEIECRAAAAEARAAKAAQELDARQGQAENVLQVHRERLRHASEQMHGEFQSSAEATLAKTRSDLEASRTEALKCWMEKLSASGAAGVLDAAAALQSEARAQLEKAEVQLNGRAQQAFDSASQRMKEALEGFADSLGAHMEEAEAGELEKARRIFAGAASEELDTASRAFVKAAEAAAVTLGEMIGERTETALAQFSSAVERKSGEERTNLETAGENVLHNLQAHAQTSFEHFQEQLALKSEQAVRDGGDALGHQLETRIEKFRERNEAALEEWSVKQQARSERAFEAIQERIQRAAQAAIEATLEQLEHRMEERIGLATRATERAVRQACADVFDAVAQRMREQLQGIGDMQHPPAEEINQREHCASA